MQPRIRACTKQFSTGGTWTRSISCCDLVVSNGRRGYQAVLLCGSISAYSGGVFTLTLLDGVNVLVECFEVRACFVHGDGRLRLADLAYDQMHFNREATFKPPRTTILNEPLQTGQFTTVIELTPVSWQGFIYLMRYRLCRV